VGNEVGAFVRICVGELLRVGEFVVIEVGLLVGPFVETSVGLALGVFFEGELEGAEVGSFVRGVG